MIMKIEDLVIFVFYVLGTVNGEQVLGKVIVQVQILDKLKSKVLLENKFFYFYSTVVNLLNKIVMFNIYKELVFLIYIYYCKQ